jgi:hypothetical protein
VSSFTGVNARLTFTSFSSLSAIVSPPSWP